LFASLGDQRTSDMRINFAQAFNALGTIIGPAVGSYFLLRNNVAGSTDLTSVKTLYIVIGSVIATIAILFSFVKVPALIDPHGAVDPAAANVDTHPEKGLFQHRHFKWAVLAQFFNVAAQAGTWAFFINYGHEEMGFSDAVAGNYMIIFFVLMLTGRFVGTFLMRFIAPHSLLAIFAACNIVMCLIIAQSLGWPSFIAFVDAELLFQYHVPDHF
jgi:FHS family L-fucose permease-like MFS transporter